MKSSTVALALATLFLLAAVPAAAVTDAQIASIVVTANQVDIDAGKVAMERGADSEVRKFGELMATDHAGVNQAAVDLVTRLGVTPEDNPTSESLRQAGLENLERLESLDGAAFDKAYIDHEVAYHEQVIGALDETLIPGAQNEELKALLVKVRPAFVAHLEHARKLQSALADH